MSVFITNDELDLFARKGFGGKAVKDTVDTYRAQGLSDDQIRSKIDDKIKDWAKEQYGAENVERASAAVAKAQAETPSNTLLDNMLTKEALSAGLKGGAVFGERMLNGATIGAYDWANDKIGGNARQRYAEVLDEAKRAGTGGFTQGLMIGGDIVGGVMSPIAGGVVRGAGSVANGIGNNFLRSVAQGGLGGGAFGGVRSAFDSDFDLAQTAKGAMLGGAVGAAIPVAQEGVKLAKTAAKNVVHATRNAVDKITHNALSPSAEDMAAGASEIAGALPDNGEIAGAAVKNLSDDITRNVKDKASALYNEAEKLAAGRKVILDKNSNFAKEFNKLSENATKSGRAELNKVWEEVGHTQYDAPTYETAKSFRSWLSEKSATGGTGLTKKQYGDLLAGLDKDIEASMGSKAAAAKKAADAFYRNEMANPDSITNSVNKMLRNDPASVVGNRAVASAQGKAWKASPLQKMLDEGERIGSPYVADVKQALQANTTTRAQFNRMSPVQKQMVYGDKLAAAEKNFNGGILNFVEKAADKTTDVVLTPIERVLAALNPVPTIQGTLAGVKFTGQLKNAANKTHVSDVKMRPISQKRLNEINIARASQGLPLIDGRKVIVPAEQIMHMNKERISGDGYTKSELLRTLNRALYGNETQVSRQSTPVTLQALINNDGHHENIAIIGKHRDNGNVFVKTGYHLPGNKINPKKMIDYTRDGRPNPSSTSLNAPGSGLSALPGIYNNISPKQSDVKKIQAAMAIINALNAQ